MTVRHDTATDPKTVARVRKNLELTRRFTLQIFDDPSILDEIPDGGTIIFIPDDDPKLAEENLEGGMRMVREGQDIYFRHVPGSAKDGDGA